MNNLKKGFTLIELLVVVAIIGILASVVLASLNTARTKGADAAIKSNLDNMRAQAAMYYDGANKYNADGVTAISCSVTGVTPTGCNALFADTTMLAGLKAAASASGATVNGYTNALGDAYVIESPLKTASTWWCVDSTGKSVSETVTLPAANITSASCN
jgi:prepilin-type N-terminal cleavage/methylation domain-containing protein